MRFLPDAFVDQDIGIDRHADGEDDPRDARQGERRPRSTRLAKMNETWTASAILAKTPNMP